MPRAGAFHHPPFGGRYRSWFALLRNFGSQLASRQLLASGVGVVGAVEIYARPIWQLSQPLQGVESVGQERRVMVIDRGNDDLEGDAAGVHGHRALDASFSSIHRTPTRFLAAARRFGDAAVDGQVGQFEAEEAIVSFERQQAMTMLVSRRILPLIRVDLLAALLYSASHHVQFVRFDST